MQLRPAVLALAPCFIVLAQACSSPKLYAKHERELASAQSLMEGGDYAAATSTLENVVGETNADPKTYGVQRYYANLLLARVHLLASIHGAFLPEARSARPRVGAIEAMSGGPAAAPGSVTAHLVAAALCVGYAEDWNDDIASAPVRVGDDRLLPTDLEKGGINRAQRELELDGLVLVKRLGFRNEVDRKLDETPALTSLDVCRKVLADVGYPKALTPWIYYAVQAYLRPRDEIKAYPFAVMTLMTKQDAGGTLPRGAAADIRKWLVEESRYSFVCPKCSAAIVPEYGDCQNCHIPTLQFLATKKARQGQPQ